MHSSLQETGNPRTAVTANVISRAACTYTQARLLFGSGPKNLGTLYDTQCLRNIVPMKHVFSKLLFFYQMSVRFMMRKVDSEPEKAKTLIYKGQRILIT